MQSLKFRTSLFLAFLFLCLFVASATAQQGQIVFKLKSSNKKSACINSKNLCSDFESSFNLSFTLNKKKSIAPLQSEMIFSAEVENKDVQTTINEMMATGKFEYVESDFVSQPLATTPSPTIPRDSNFDKQWVYKNEGDLDYIYSKDDADIDMEYAWSLQQGSSAITVAILDTGVDYQHPDLVNRMWVNETEIPGNGLDDDNNGYIDDVSGYDFANNDNDPMDVNGHGTHVAGIVGAEAGNDTGFVGIDWNCKLMALKVVRDNNTSNYSDYAAAIFYAVAKGAKVINLSLTSYNPSAVLDEAFAYAHSQGVVIVVAMANNGDRTTHYMAQNPHSIAVGATTPSDKRASFSNYNSYIDVVAPGSVIFGLNIADYEDDNFTLNGTSQSTPLVSGLVSLLFAQDLTRTPEEIRHIIRTSADDQVGPSNEDVAGHDDYFGYGRINAFNALSQYFDQFEQVEFHAQAAGQVEQMSPCQTIIESNFEGQAKQDWVLGSAVELSKQFGTGNSPSIKLSDDKGAESSISTITLNLEDKDLLNIEFSCYPVSMEKGEDFIIEYSVDGGNSFDYLTSFVSGTDFKNKELFQHRQSFTDLALTSETVIRFRCDASASSDLIFLDDIKIEACQQSGLSCNVGQACDDYNPCTVNDVVTESCNCEGTYEDKDNDGICVGEDVDDLDSCIPLNPECGDAVDTNSSCNTIHTESFETKETLWFAGGVHAKIERELANSGNSSVRLESGKGTESSISTRSASYIRYNEVNISFSYQPISMESGEEFVFEVSTDGGESFQVLQAWVAGEDFTNNSTNNGLVYIPNQFLADSNVFRFRCNANSTSNSVNLDDIAIEVCGASDRENYGIASIDVNSEDISTERIEMIEINAFPNPTIDNITLDHPIFSEQPTEVFVFSSTGALVSNIQFSVEDEVRLDVSRLQGSSTYFVKVVASSSTSFTTSFFKH